MITVLPHVTGMSTRERSRAYLRLGQRLLVRGDSERAIGACERALHLDPELLAARRLKSEALFSAGYFDEAITHLVTLRHLDKGDARTASLLAQALTARARRNDAARHLTATHGFRISKCLGIGSEGAVYLTRDPDKHSRVVKTLHLPHVAQLNKTGPLRIWRKPVRRYRCDLVRLSLTLKQVPRVGTLYPFDLLEKDGLIKGFVYPYEPLIRIHRRYLALPDVANAVMGAFFRMQAYLLEHLGLCVIDAKLANFMITRTGDIRYVDYGRGFVPMDDFRCLEDHMELTALLRLSKEALGLSRLEPFARDLRATCEAFTRLQPLAERHAWVRTVLSRISAGQVNSFLTPDYYLHLASTLPRRIRATSQASILGFNALTTIRRQIAKRVGVRSNHMPW
jgi:hypothetical protein